MQDSLGNALYLRGANAEMAGWKIVTEESGMTEYGTLGSVLFSEINPDFNQLGQLVAIRDSMQFGRPRVAVVHAYDTAVYQRGGSSMALAVQSASKGLLLPQYTSVVLQNIPSPAEGSLHFYRLKHIACFDGIQWQLL
jgi:hypothetical protein